MSIAQKKLSTSLRHPGELPSFVDEKTFTEFLSRQTDVLDKFEALILKLENSPEKQCMAELKRMIHTIKGEAGLLALYDVERVCHRTEDLLSRTSPDHSVDLLLSVKDWITSAFQYYAGIVEQFPDVRDIITTVEQELKKNFANSYADINPLEFAEVTDQMEALISPSPACLDMDSVILNRFSSFIHNQIEKMGIQLIQLETDPKQQEPCDEILRCFNRIEGIAAFFSIKGISALAGEITNLLGQTQKGRMLLDSPIIDLTFETVDTLKELVSAMQAAHASHDMISEHTNLSSLLSRIHLASKGRFVTPQNQMQIHSEKKIGELLVASGSIEPDAIEKTLKRQMISGTDKRLGEMLIVDDHIPPREVAHALRGQQEVSQRVAGITAGKSIGVDGERLDRLVEMLGELATAESAVSQSTEIRNLSSQGLNGCLRELDRITQEVQQLGLSLRMIPIRPIFQKMERVVRDIARKTKKKTKCLISGQETELDKTLVDKIGDPLIHIVRNAVDHGIEDSIEARRKAGKNDTGIVEIRAFHRGGNIYIEIEDDGIGIDSKMVFEKAKRLGLIDSGETFQETQALDLVFKPGFSTAPSVTEISGRGVGLDVVKRSIESLRGQVYLRSNPGQGSLFTLRIPLTLAIIDGMVVRMGRERYIIPTLSIIKTLRLDAENIISVQGDNQVVEILDRLVPLVSTKELFGFEPGTTDDEAVLIVVVEDGSTWTGLVIDELVGKQQVVIKSLGEKLKNIPGISGVAVMPDGHIGLIIDTNGLVRIARTKNKQIS